MLDSQQDKPLSKKEKNFFSSINFFSILMGSFKVVIAAILGGGGVLFIGKCLPNVLHLSGHELPNVVLQAIWVFVLSLFALLDSEASPFHKGIQETSQMAQLYAVLVMSIIPAIK